MRNKDYILKHDDKIYFSLYKLLPNLLAGKYVRLCKYYNKEVHRLNDINSDGKTCKRLSYCLTPREIIWINLQTAKDYMIEIKKKPSYIKKSKIINMHTVFEVNKIFKERGIILHDKI